VLRALLLVAGLVLLVYLVVRLGPGEVWALIAGIGWGFAPVVAFYAVHQGFRAWALRLSAVRAEAVRFGDALAIRLSGEAVQFLTSTGPFLAEPSKALLLGRRGLTKTEGFAATIAEYLAYTLVSAVMLVGATWYLTTQVALAPALHYTATVLFVSSGLFVAVAAVAIARRIYLIGGVAARLSRAPWLGRRLKLEAGAVRRMEDLLLAVLRERPARFAAILLLEACSHALLVVELWWILRVTGVESAFDRALVLESAGKFTGLAFFFVPAQLGASEGVNVVLFRALGLAGAAGVGVALARRIRSAVTASAGLAALALMTRRAKSAGDGAAPTRP